MTWRLSLKSFFHDLLTLWGLDLTFPAFAVVAPKKTTPGHRPGFWTMTSLDVRTSDSETCSEEQLVLCLLELLIPGAGSGFYFSNLPWDLYWSRSGTSPDSKPSISLRQRTGWIVEDAVKFVWCYFYQCVLWHVGTHSTECGSHLINAACVWCKENTSCAYSIINTGSVLPVRWSYCSCLRLFHHVTVVTLTCQHELF